MTPDELHSNIIVGVVQTYLKPNYSQMWLNGKISGVSLTVDNMEELFTFYKIGIITLNRDATSQHLSLIPYEIKPDSNGNGMSSFSLSLEEHFFQTTEYESPKLIIISCNSIKNLEETKLIEIDDPKGLRNNCDYNINTWYTRDYILNRKLSLSYTLPKTKLNYKTYVTEATTKEYWYHFQIRENNKLNYQHKQQKINIHYDNYFFFGKSQGKTHLNWKSQEQTWNDDYEISTDFYWSIYFSPIDENRILYYKVTKGSLIDILIDLGGLLKVFGTLSFIPYLWNTYYEEKALLIISTLFSKNKTHGLILNEEMEEKDEKDEKWNKWITTDKADINWRWYTFSDWFCSTYCCCSSKSKVFKYEKDKILNELECTTFIKFGTESKSWTNLNNYFK